ncbi:uncharacterized protein LOC135124621 [Zophobas morio]|uniref:uncharacterized protein LOC135124621 n=1 Tax=Zophobas morio TaxID=2755281 RepID=UPI0030839498
MNSQQETRLMQSYDENPLIILKNIKEVINKLGYCHVSELEALLKDVMFSLLTAAQKIYAKNTSIVQSNSGDVLEIIRSNFQVAIHLMDTLNVILQHVLKISSEVFNLVASVPVSMADVLFLTFDHCKRSQKIYTCYYKSVEEIVVLFRKSQEVYTKYLSFLDTHLTIDFFNETHVVAYKKIVDTILEISRTLSGVNMKSMADSWKGFIGFVQKTPNNGVLSLNLSPAIQILTEEINNNLQLLTEGEVPDSVKFNQNFKVTGFLVKVVLKLFETGLNLTDSYEDILIFWVMIFSWHDGFFRTNNFPEQIVDCVSAIFHLSSESKTPSMKDSGFLKFCVMHEKFPTSKQNFGFLILINLLMKELPQLMEHEQELVNEFKIIFLIRQVLNLTRSCYVEYYYDYDSDFYDEFIMNVAVVILLFPNQFWEIEDILMECVVGEHIWTSLIVTDIWCLVLKYSTDKVCQLTLNTLIKKIGELGLGVFHETSAIIRLKVLVQRILTSLSNAGRHNEVAKYSPSDQLSVWKILTCRSVPLSYRYYVEFFMSDIFEKMDIIEKEDYTYSDILNLMEIVGIVSYTKFNDLEINTTKLLPVVMHLWSFDMHDVHSTNVFFKYFLSKLIRITVAVSGELTSDDLHLILAQLKVLLTGSISKILINDILHEVAKRNFNHLPDKHPLLSLIYEIFKILLNDKNIIIVQLALESFINMLNGDSSYEIAINKVSNNSLKSKQDIVYYSQKCAAKLKYNFKNLENIQSDKCQHHCGFTNSYQPACKKIKIDDADAVISNLKDNTEKLLNVSKCELTTKQRSDIKIVIDKLGILL